MTLSTPKTKMGRDTGYVLSDALRQLHCLFAMSCHVQGRNRKGILQGSASEHGIEVV